MLFKGSEQQLELKLLLFKIREQMLNNSTWFVSKNY